MSEANDQPAEAGVEGQGDSAPSDDIDTTSFDRMEAPDEDESAPQPDEAEETPGSDPDKAEAAPQDDGLVEIEHEGQRFRVPPALRDLSLKGADYTRKTQELADNRRAFDEERTSWESQREQSRAALPEEHARVAVLQNGLSQLEARLDPKGRDLGAVDWDAYRRQIDGLAADDPERIKYARLRDEYMSLRDRRIDLGDQLEAARKDLQTKDEARLNEQREKDGASLRQAQQETGRVLAAEVPGWSQERAAQVIQFMEADLKLTQEEIGSATDPRTWKVVDRLMKAEAEVAALRKAQKQQQTATNHLKAQESKPAESARGAGASLRDPATPRGDGLSVKEWMRRRNEQEVRARAGR